MVKNKLPKREQLPTLSVKNGYQGEFENNDFYYAGYEENNYFIFLLLLHQVIPLKN